MRNSHLWLLFLLLFRMSGSKPITGGWQSYDGNQAINQSSSTAFNQAINQSSSTAFNLQEANAEEI
jgi:hypothetical protein